MIVLLVAVNNVVVGMFDSAGSDGRCATWTIVGGVLVSANSGDGATLSIVADNGVDVSDSNAGGATVVVKIAGAFVFFCFFGLSTLVWPTSAMRFLAAVVGDVVLAVDVEAVLTVVSPRFSAFKLHISVPIGTVSSPFRAFSVRHFARNHAGVPFRDGGFKLGEMCQRSRHCMHAKSLTCTKRSHISSTTTPYC
jgi:hypothetical protein